MITVLVALGGGLGAALRYWLGTAVQGLAPGAFPWGTLVVNVAGCLAMGVLSAFADRPGLISIEARAFLAVGILGGFTTFSAFANETAMLARGGAMPGAALNVAASVGLCLTAVWAGRALGAGWLR